MKNCLLFGFLSALAGAILTLLLYFAGLQEDLHGLAIAEKVGFVVGLAIVITFMALGTKAVREDTPPGEAFGYGRALWAAFRIGVISTVISTAFYLLYYTVINPGIGDLMLRERMAAAAAKGVSDAQLEKMESFTRMTLSPAWIGIFSIVGGILFALILALVVAAFLRRPAAAAAVPPPL